MNEGNEFLDLIGVLVFRTLRDLIMFPKTWEMHLDEAIRSNALTLGLNLDPEHSAKVRRMVDLEIKAELNPPKHSNEATLDPFQSVKDTSNFFLTAGEMLLIRAGKRLQAVKEIRERTLCEAKLALAVVDSHMKPKE